VELCCIYILLFFYSSLAYFRLQTLLALPCTWQKDWLCQGYFLKVYFSIRFGSFLCTRNPERLALNVIAPIHPWSAVIFYYLDPFPSPRIMVFFCSLSLAMIGFHLCLESHKTFWTSSSWRVLFYKCDKDIKSSWEFLPFLQLLLIATPGSWILSLTSLFLPQLFWWVFSVVHVKELARQKLISFVPITLSGSVSSYDSLVIILSSSSSYICIYV
jgi:hypothetical protein